MSKYEVGDKVVMEITETFLDCIKTKCCVIDGFGKCSESYLKGHSEPLTTYTEPLEAKIRRQAAEITRLLAENKELKEDFKDIEPLDAKIERQAKVITRLLAINERLKAENKKMSAKIDAYELYGDQHKEEYNQAFNQGAETAWELARKCMLMTDREREMIFGSGHNALYGVLTYFDYKHAAAKVAEWEKRKEEINIGDVIRINEDSDFYGLVININPESRIAFVVSENRSLSFISLECCIKTGRHIDVDSFLKQIGGEQE